MADASRGPSDGGNRPAPTDAGWIARVCGLFVTGGTSTRRIAAEPGLLRTRVLAALRAGNVDVSGRGAGCGRPQVRLRRPARLRAMLADLYVRRRLTRAQGATVLGVPESRVRTGLGELKVPRSRGCAYWEDRRRLPKKALLALHQRVELSADQVAVRLGATRSRVLASEHEQDVPVRPGGLDNTRAVAILSALYDDDGVVRVLRRHRVSRVRQPGLITERFQKPVLASAMDPVKITPARGPGSGLGLLTPPFAVRGGRP